MTKPAVYQFWDRRWRKHDCGLCWATIQRNNCAAHAQYHHQRGDLPDPPDHPSTFPVLEVTVEPDGRAHRTNHGCWELT